jgi:ribosomal protein S12 methylthiotransferase accessory factor YcaO
VFIHGAREDILTKPVYQAEHAANSAGARYFESLEPSATWPDLEAMPSVRYHDNLDVLLERIVSELSAAGHRRLIGFDLTDPVAGIAVVKVIAPSLRFNHKLF